MTLRTRLLLTALFTVSLTTPLSAQRSEFERGFNIFTIAQDVEFGRLVSKDMEAQVEVLRNPPINKYLDSLCEGLASKAPHGAEFRFQCRVTNDRSVNAVGLPGGFLYINRGTIEAAANEAQLANVIAHEIAHVVLRHGTHQISKAYALQVPASTLRAAGGTPVTVVLAKIDGGFTASSTLLKNSIAAENEADLVGLHILYDAGYDPRAAVEFFERLRKETKPTAASPSGHADLENRSRMIVKEIQTLGRGTPNAILDSPDFQKLKLLVAAIGPF